MKNTLHNSTPGGNKLETPLYGLILSGGKSSRMGMDKATLDYHGKPQSEFLYELVKGYCDRTFLSIRKEQLADVSADFPYILDNDEYRGPFNGLLSAHLLFPEVAWMVFACDLPLLDTKTIELLVHNRDAKKDATALATRESGLPEPLAAIWEPKGLQKAMDYLKTSTSSCPRKFLINSDIHLLFPKDDKVLTNANSLDEYKQIKQTLETN